MGHLQPLVTRQYTDFGMQRNAICQSSGVAYRFKPPSPGGRSPRSGQAGRFA